jgi:1-pyrroline-5-carboxylate dehydrogenase
LVRSAFEYQGQRCPAASRAYIPRSLWRKLEGPLTDIVANLRVGDVTEHETFVGAVIDEASSRRLEQAIDRAKSLDSHRLLVGGSVRREIGWFVDPTGFVTDDPAAFTLSQEFFGPLLTVHVYEDADWTRILTLADTTGPYALTCSIFATERTAITEALSVLRDAAGMTYVNDKRTGALHSGVHPSVQRFPHGESDHISVLFH